MTPREEGIARGQKERGSGLPEPYPPYPIGTREANEWMEGYREGRYPKKPGPSETKDAINKT